MPPFAANAIGKGQHGDSIGGVRGEAAAIILTAELEARDQAWADQLRRRHFPPERNHLAAHITLFHHLPPSIEPDLRRMLAMFSRDAPPEARIDGLFSLGRGVAISIRSPGLLALRDRLAEAFNACLIPQDRHTPRLHITVQNKVDAAVARETLETLRPLVSPRLTRIAALACWHYRGGPWSPIARYAFRG